jgi:hypothetical protein
MKKGKLVGASGKSVPQEPLEELKGIARSCYVELQNKGLTAEQRVERGDTLKVVLATLEEKGWSMTLTQDGNMGDFEETDGEYDPTIKIPFCIACGCEGSPRERTQKQAKTDRQSSGSALPVTGSKSVQFFTFWLFAQQRISRRA